MAALQDERKNPHTTQTRLFQGHRLQMLGGLRLMASALPLGQVAQALGRGHGGWSPADVNESRRNETIVFQNIPFKKGECINWSP